MTARIAAFFIVLTALIAGVGLYYTQVYAFYDELGPDQITLVVPTDQTTGQPMQGIVPLEARAIDSISSPIRFRACYRLPPDTPTELFVSYPEAEPLNAPSWFECFDARNIGESLEAGTMTGVLVQNNISYGVDRVAAVDADGQVFVWHQINRCGEAHFNGDRVPDDCPAPPTPARN